MRACSMASGGVFFAPDEIERQENKQKQNVPKETFAIFKTANVLREKPLTKTDLKNAA